MAKKVKLEGYCETRLDLQKEIEGLVGKAHVFPKYTTQLINIANQNAQGTRPRIVGQMSELIKQCPDKSYAGWKTWYLESHPDAIDDATDRIVPMIQNFREAIDEIDRDMVREWVEDLTINKTAEGLILQEVILGYVAGRRGLPWRPATPEEEGRNIDGYIGESPIQVKPCTYLSQRPIVREEIEVETIYYKKTPKNLLIYVKEGIPPCK